MRSKKVEVTIMAEQRLECIADYLKRKQNFFNMTHLGKPYSETEQPEIPVYRSSYRTMQPEIPVYRSSYRTIGVDFGNIDASKEIGMLQGYAQAQQRVKYVDTDTTAQVVRYVDEDIKQTAKMCKEMLNMRFGKYFEIQKVIFNAPATIVFWKDGTKTVVQAQKGDKFDPEKGLAMAFAKRAGGDKGNYYNVFRKHLPKAKALKTTAGRKKTGKNTVEYSYVLENKGVIHHGTICIDAKATMDEVKVAVLDEFERVTITKLGEE